MRYYKINKCDGSKEEISRADAADLLTGSYINIDDLLAHEQTIPLMFSYIEVESD